MTNIVYKRLRIFVGTYLRWLLISFYETKATYNNTKIGLLWVPLSNMIFIVLLVLLFGRGGSADKLDYFIYVSAGFMLWTFIAETISNGSIIFLSKKDFAISNSITLDNLLVKETTDRIFRHLLNMALLMVVIGFIAPLDMPLILLLYAVFVVFIFRTSVYLSYILSSVVVLYPDVGKGIPTATRFLFFASPVFWKVDVEASLSGVDGTNFRVLLETFNPVSYYLSMTRQVFGIEAFSLNRVAIGVGITVLLALIARALEWKLGKKIRNIY